jgi:16S rRNA (guanine527-N7)-methyltransferase
LVESSSRKSVVLAEVVGALGLENAVVYNGRAESLLGRREFEVVVSRAAGSLRRLAPVAVGLLGGGGRYVALKGGGAEREIEEVVPMLARLGAELVEVTAPLHEREPGVPSRVSLVVIDKI